MYNTACPLSKSVILVPLNTLIKRHPGTTENIQRAPYRQIYLAFTTNMHFLKILQTPCSTSIRNGYGAPLRES